MANPPDFGPEMSFGNRRQLHCTRDVQSANLIYVLLGEFFKPSDHAVAVSASRRLF